ncbi:hypothetical protein Rhe02_84080 [Rhizocola hellebori]|uniref:Uncharacterized protein n=1 Tax=Rhizocola hellebori TaxID=1392758 RepID=A0A8J3QJL5_9ACTN|nr:hypothetical protein [Rhizocola hellebori]GIH10341.1 hypothetical protein Rhe02_84080 [Rhizocola hellebori]
MTRLAGYLPSFAVFALAAALAVATARADRLSYTPYTVWVMFVVVCAAAYVGHHAPTREQPGGLSPLRSVAAIVVAAVLVVAPTGLIYWTGPDCPSTCYRFEKGTEGWGIRIENDVLLGRTALKSETVDAGGLVGKGSLAVSFQLAAAPRDKTQVKIEGPKLEKELAAHLFVPAELPSSLVLSGFVLEHNEAGSGRPVWLFFQTRPVPLAPGEWNHAVFRVDQFGTGDQRLSWGNPPLMVGFEVRDQSGGQVNGVVYFDQISVR